MFHVLKKGGCVVAAGLQCVCLSLRLRIQQQLECKVVQCVSLVCKTGLNFGGRVVVVVDCVSPSFDEVPSINDLIQSAHSSRDNPIVSDDI